MTLKAHSNKVYMLSLQLGKKIQLTEEKLRELSLAAKLHDIGKIRVPEEILNKSEKLTEEEMNIMKLHVRYGADIAREMGYNDMIVASVLYHHERYDGQGYLKGIRGKEIPLYSRVIAITDSFDAMTSNRCYKKAISLRKAIDEIRINSGYQFDPNLCKEFLELLSESSKNNYYPAEKVFLNYK